MNFIANIFAKAGAAWSGAKAIGLKSIVETAWTGTKATLGIGAAVGVAEVGLRGAEKSSLIGMYENVRDGLMSSEATAGSSAMFSGFYQLLIEVANLLGLDADNGFRNFVENRMNVEAGSTYLLEDNTNDSNGSDTIIGASGNDTLQTASLNAPDAMGDTLALGAGGVALAVGARSIPVLASVFAAADTVGDVAGYALKGEWKKAGVRTASGITETVLASGGALTATFGVAAREAIEEAGAYVLGEDARVPDSVLAGAAYKATDYVMG